MKRSVFAIALLFAAITVQAQAQSSEFRIDQLTDGSLYLVEIITPAPDSTGKIGPPTEMPLKLKDMAAVQALAQGLKDMGAKERKAAEIKASFYDSAATKIAALIAVKEGKPTAAKPERKGKKQ